MFGLTRKKQVTEKTPLQGGMDLGKYSRVALKENGGLEQKQYTRFEQSQIRQVSARTIQKETPVRLSEQSEPTHFPPHGFSEQLETEVRVPVSVLRHALPSRFDAD